MRRALKWIGIVLGVLLVVLGVGVGALYATGSNKWAQSYQAPASSVVVPTDEAAIERGEHIVTALSACQACHGESLGGAMFIEEEGFATIAAPNLTAGAGGVGATNTDEQWVHAIRYGIGNDGHGLFGMPSSQYTYLSDEDLGAMIAYLKSIPPVDNPLPARAVAFLPKVLAGVGALPLMPDLIPSDLARPAPAEGDPLQVGHYLTQIGACRECHGENLAGLTDENGPPPGPNLTPGGEMAGWTEADFVNALRTGQTPTGRELSPEMPWMEYRNMTDAELSAIWSYLQSLPARETGANE